MKVIWAEYFNGVPNSGIASNEEGQFFYFKGRGVPGFVSSVEDIRLPGVEVEGEKTPYLLYRITSDQERILTAEHDKVSEVTGAPKRHGDPRIFWLSQPQKPIEHSVLAGPDGTVEASFQNTAPSTFYSYTIGVDSMRGEYQGVVTKDNFSNYDVEYLSEFR